MRLDLRDCSQSGDLAAMERVWLEVHGSASRHLSSIAIPLLLADLPMFLWWPGPVPHQHHQLSDTADRLIVDSSQFGHASDLAVRGWRTCSDRASWRRSI